MSDNQNSDTQDIDTQDSDDTNAPNQNSNSNPTSTLSDPVEKLVESRIRDALKDIKNKLDTAYTSRDDALKRLAELEQGRKQEELRRLQDEGKHKEALELQLAEERAQKSAYEKRVIELTRDMELRSALVSYSFKNDNAFNMAYREVVEQLTQDETGVWRHKSGVSLKDFVKQFADAEENAFLLKPKVSSGSGISPSSRTTNTSSGLDGKSIFSLSQEEVLKLAREGKLAGAKR
jgi:hypothetical protein